VVRSPGTIIFGSGQRDSLPGYASRFGSRVFICSDERFSQAPQLVAIHDALRAAGLVVGVYDATLPELPLSCISDATERARAFGPDVIIGLGGGSCLDVAKLVALGLSHGGAMRDYYGEFKVPGPVLPVIAIPTTAGTGSEVTPVAVLGDPERDLKVGISSPYLIPSVAICDPELTLTCPAGLTAVTGADAMTHAIEAFTAITHADPVGISGRQVFVGKNQFSDAFCRIAIANLAEGLPIAVQNGDDLKAREKVMYGALTAGLAFGVAGTAAAHALQYPVGAATGTAHGLGVACLMPYVLAFNRPTIGPQLAEIGALCGGDATEQGGMAAIAGLFARIGIPRSLADLGIGAHQIDRLAEQSMGAARLVNNNPRPLDVEAARAILAAALAGEPVA
jgi:alcohol dehydrogenase